jgi:hypothetical protein
MYGVLFHGVWSCASDVYCGGRCLRREGREGKARDGKRKKAKEKLCLLMAPRWDSLSRAAMRVDDLTGRPLTWAYLCC